MLLFRYAFSSDSLPKASIPAERKTDLSSFESPLNKNPLLYMILLFSVFTEAVRGISSDRADVKEKRSAFLSEPVCLLILVFSFLISCSGVKQNSAKIENGVLELSAFSIPKEEIVSLEGKWTFFWGKLYSSSEAELKQNESDFFTVPSSWNGKKLSDGTELSGQGKATYRLRIHLKDGLEKEELSFKFLSISSAYDLFINGKKIHSVGKTGGDISLETAAYLPDTVDLPHLTDKNLEILIHITNYHHNKGGIWRKILFGRKKDIQRKRYLELFQDVFLAGSLFIIGIYHLGIYYQIRKEKFSLYFALFCLMVFLRICFTGEMIFSYLFPNFPWNWQITFEYLNFQAAVVFGLLYFATLFRKNVLQWTEKGFAGVFLALALFTLLTPPDIFTQSLFLQEMLIFAIIIYAVIILILSLKRNQDGSYVFVFGLLLLGSTVLNDILFVAGKIETGLYSPLGFFFFIFTQAFLISTFFNRALVKVANLSEKLLETNRSYGRFVPVEFLSILGKKDVTNVGLGDVIEQEVNLLFCDIRSFTALSEKSKPTEVFNFLNSYFEKMNELIIRYEGIIDKYIGDAILAIFPGRPENAVNCAIEMQKLLRDYDFFLGNEKKKISAGIAIHHGQVLLGVIGGQKLIQTTVISDAVNTCARLQSLTKTYGVSVIISETILNNLDDPADYRIRFLDHAVVPGKEETIYVCEIYDHESEDQIRLKIQSKRAFDQGIMIYHTGDHEKAWNSFMEVLKINPQDSAAIVYMNRAATYLVQGETLIYESYDKLVKWDNSWETGIKIIDEQHKMLFDIINDLHKAMKLGREKEILSRIFKSLRMYIFTHFRVEEELMHKSDYPDFTGHKNQHDQFIQYIEVMYSAFRTQQKEVTSEILEFLKTWLTAHIINEDKQGYVPYIKIEKESNALNIMDVRL